MPRPIKTLLTVLTFETVLAAILFVSAGRVDLPWVWGLIASHGIILFVGQMRGNLDRPDISKRYARIFRLTTRVTARQM